MGKAIIIYHLSLIIVLSALYNCRFATTNVMISLQIRLFMQNKANFPDAQMNVNKVLTKNYEKRTLGERGKNKANSKPNKANFKKAKMNVTVFYIKDYENMSNWAIYENKANFNPKQTQTKPISKAKKYCSPPFCCGMSYGEK